MCGIAGVYCLDNIKSEQVIADGFCQSLNHRGPNSHCNYIDNEVILSHVRLSIIDLDERSSQSFKSEDGGFLLVINGELYNYQEVKKELSDYPFFTDSDTEVLLTAWMIWGQNVLRN